MWRRASVERGWCQSGERVVISGYIIRGHISKGEI